MYLAGERDVEQVARGALDRFRSTEVSGDEHEEGRRRRRRRQSERWNYASVHLTECDESDRNSRQRPSRASSRSREYIIGLETGTCIIQPQPWNWKWDSFAKMLQIQNHFPPSFSRTFISIHVWFFIFDFYLYKYIYFLIYILFCWIWEREKFYIYIWHSREKWYKYEFFWLAIRSADEGIFICPKSWKNLEESRDSSAKAEQKGAEKTREGMFLRVNL